MIIVLVITLLTSACSTTEYQTMALINGKLPPCPERLNCISSQSDDRRYRVEPLHFTGEPKHAWQNLREALQSMGGKVEQDESPYLWVTFKSRVFGFVDDMELLLNNNQQLIELRSASRSGYYDFGVNRKRAEQLRQRFKKLQNSRPASP